MAFIKRLFKWVLSNWGGRIAIILVLLVLVLGIITNPRQFLDGTVLFNVGVLGTFLFGIIGATIGEIVKFIIKKVKRR